MDKYFIISPESVGRLLAKIIVVLLLANLVSIYLKWELGYVTAFGLVPLFDFDQEYNIPTMYSALTILLSAGLLRYIANKRKIARFDDHHYWRRLSYLFIILSLDELISLHNQSSRITEVIFQSLPAIANEEIITQSRFWILTFIPVLVLLSLFFIRFYLALPSETKTYFAIAGAVFISGAVGVELLGDQYIIKNTYADLNYGLLYTFEELLEMTGIAIFICALVAYISRYIQHPKIDIQIDFPSPNSSRRSEHIYHLEEVVKMV